MSSLYIYGKRILLGLFVVSVLAACSSMDKKGGVMSAEEYLQRGLIQLRNAEVSSAGLTLDEMELHYPVNVETADLHIALLKKYHLANNPEVTVLSAHRFINMFSGHSHVDFAYYAGGMGNFDRGLQRLTLTLGDANPEFAKESMKSFKALLRCCEISEHAPEAKEKINELREAIAMYELALMEEELLNGNEDAGTDRGWYIVSNYEGTVAAARALAILSGEVALGKEVAAELEPVVEVEPEPVVEVPVEIEPEVVAPVMNAVYVIQLASYKDLDGLKQEMASLNLSRIQLHRRDVNGESFFSAVYGGYANEAAAADDLARLKVELGQQDLWLRKTSWSQPLN